MFDIIAEPYHIQTKMSPAEIRKNVEYMMELVGLDKSRELARGYADSAQAALARFDGREAAFLAALADYTVNRTA